VKTHVKKYPQFEMLPLEAKRSGCKLLPHSDLRGGGFPEEVSRNWKRDIVLGTWSCGDWMELAQDRDGWRTLVGMVWNLRVPEMRGIS
jgi:hypothetical protein